MNFAENLIELRRKHGLSQEGLGEIVGVSRQTVSKWELGLTTPELDKLVGLAEYFHVSLDALVGRDWAQPEPAPAPSVQPGCGQWHYEYKSQRTLWGLPLVHINMQNWGFARAKGIIAIGNIATGFVAVGALAVGLLSFGGVALGLIALGGVALGLLLALGGVALGGVALGGVALGLIAIGGAALGYVALGGCASGTYAAGEWASGSRLSLSSLGSMRETWRQAKLPRDMSREGLLQGLLQECPGIPGWVAWLLCLLLP